MTKKQIGELGEIAAARFLRDKGYIIADTNYICRFGEVDIIAIIDNYLCFAEVKTRSENMLFAPKEAVDVHKRLRIISSAENFIRSKKSELQPRFDIIEVYMEGENAVKINHIENAYASNAL